MIRSSRQWLAASLMALATTQVLAAPIGEIFYTEGRVQVKRGSSQVDVASGYALEQGDVVLTGAASQVRMRLNDQSYFALPANSTFQIDKFSAPPPGRRRAPATAVFSLLRGGLRTVSGLIGSWSKDTYRVNTPVVTMGIRGTEYSVIHCTNNCPPDVESGSYLEILGGSVAAASVKDNTTVTLEQGQWGQATNPVRRVLSRPQVFSVDTSGVFNPEISITGVPGASRDAEVSVEIEAEIRIERPASPSAPDGQ
jgi:hypothetical protein